MQGRVLHFPEHPIECQSNYAGVGSIRCNLDVQDLRRVLPEDGWLQEGGSLPHIGDRKEWGYMNVYEWNGSTYTNRLPEETTLEGKTPERWSDHWTHDEWRTLFLQLLADGAPWPPETQT